MKKKKACWALRIRRKRATQYLPPTGRKACLLICKHHRSTPTREIRQHVRALPRKRATQYLPPTIRTNMSEVPLYYRWPDSGMHIHIYTL